MERFKPRPAGGPAVVFGLLLVLVGAGLLLVQYAPLDLGEYGWPLFVIIPGIGLIAIGFLTAETSGVVVAGCIVTTVGLILAVQNTFGLWATWAYAWALIFPGAVGVGTALLGHLRGRPDTVRAGLRAAGTGLVLFVVLGALFEGLLHLSGLSLGRVGDLLLPIALIVVGVVLLFARLFPGQSTSSSPPANPAV